MLIEGTASIWKEYVEHEFVVQLGRGTLAQPRFIHFIKWVLRSVITVEWRPTLLTTADKITTT